MICDRVLLIRDGTIVADGQTEDVLGKYIEEDLVLNKEDLIDDEDLSDIEEYNGPEGLLSERSWYENFALGNEVVKLKSIMCHNESGLPKFTFKTTEPIFITFTYKVFEDGHDLRSHIHFFDGKTGVPAFSSIESLTNYTDKKRKLGVFKTTVKIEANLMNIGQFMVGVNVICHNPLAKHLRAPRELRFEVIEDENFKSVISDYPRELPGYITPKLHWCLT